MTQENEARDIANLVSQTARSTDMQQLSEASVLWVESDPSNIVHERRSLEALGIRCTLSLSTADALEKLRTAKYDVVISDMGRSQDPLAGYTLLAEKQKLGDAIPLVIYAKGVTPEHRAEAAKRGAVGSTDRPKELF